MRRRRQAAATHHHQWHPQHAGGSLPRRMGGVAGMAARAVPQSQGASPCGGHPQSTKACARDSNHPSPNRTAAHHPCFLPPAASFSSAARDDGIRSGFLTPPTRPVGCRAAPWRGCVRSRGGACRSSTRRRCWCPCSCRWTASSAHTACSGACLPLCLQLHPLQ